MKKRITAITSILASALLLTVSVVHAQLLGMNPTQGNIGQNLPVTILGSNNIFDGSSGPGGNILQIYLQKGNDYLIMYDSNWGFSYPNIIDPNNVQTVLVMNPAYTQPGVYDLNVILTDPNGQIQYTIPAAFTVNAPTGIISGNIYKDLNRNGVKESGEPDLAGETVRIVPTGANAFFSVTDASGNFSFPAYNNNYTVSFIPSTNDLLYPTTGSGVYNVVINNNNSTGNNFGVNGAMLSVTPNVIEKGTQSTHTITANRPIFHPTSAPNGNITQSVLLSNPLFAITPSTSVTVIDSFTVQFTVNAPNYLADAAAVDLRLYTNSGSIGTHYLRGQLSIVPPPSCDPPDSTWASFVTASSFRVNWTPVANAYRYQIFYKIGGTPTWTQRSVAGNKVYMGIQNLNCGTTYRWKVRTVCQTATGTIRSVWTPVKVTNTLACGAEPVDRIAETETVSVDVFPNPASEFIAIEAGAEVSGQTEFELYNLTGALVMKKSITLQSGETIEVNVNDVPAGLYFIRMNGAVNYTSKILIQH
jgi:hypothetical protein